MSTPTDAQPTASGSSTSNADRDSGVKVFLPPTTSSSSPSMPPLSEEELKPTPEELRYAFRSTILQRNGPDAPLLTRALREKQEAQLGLHSSRHRTWTAVRIRIRFSDRTMIESTFNESDTIEAVYAFLESSLDDEAKRIGRVIYTAPPKVEYRREDSAKTLRQLGLIPSAVVSVKWDDARMNSNAFPAPLKRELRESAQPLPTTPQQDASSPAPAAAATNTTPKPKSTPKWLKNIVKK